MADWYYYLNGQDRLGPVDKAGLDALVQQGAVTNETLIWYEGAPDWIAYGSVGAEATAGAPVVDDLAACSECGSVLSKQDLIRFRGKDICSECKPKLIARMSQGLGTRSAGLAYSGLGARAGARLLDGFIGSLISAGIPFLLLLPFGGAGDELNESSAPGIVLLLAGVLNIFAPLLYSWLMTWKFGGGVGKLALGLRVVTADGDDVGFWHAGARTLVDFLTILTLFIGYLIIFFDDERRVLHDHVCGTRVVEG